MSLAALHDHEVRRMRDLGHPEAQAELVKRGLARAPEGTKVQALGFAKSYKEDRYIVRKFQK